MGKITKQKVDVSSYTFTERLYAGVDGRVYQHGDYRARNLIGSPGQVISLARADELGILDYEEKPPKYRAIAPEDEPEPEDKPPAGIAGGEE